MSIIPHGPFHESQPAVRLETFEDLRTVREAVGEHRGLEDPMTTELRDEVQQSLSRGFEFEPMSIEGNEALVIFRSLAAAKVRKDDLAIRAKDVLERQPEQPFRARAAVALTELIEMPKVLAPAKKKGPRFPMYDETEERHYPEISREPTKYNKNHPDNIRKRSQHGDLA